MLNLQIELWFEYSILTKFLKKIISLKTPQRETLYGCIQFFSKLFTDKFKNKYLANKLFPKYKEQAKESIGNFLQENNIPLKIDDISLKLIDGYYFGLYVNINDTNYNDMISCVYPLVKKYINNNEKIGDIILILDEYIVKMLHAALNTLSQDKIDELINYIVNKFALPFLRKILEINHTGINLRGLALSREGNDKISDISRILDEYTIKIL